MKSTQPIIHHPNQENKTGKVPYASPVQRNFSNTEALRGKEIHMEQARTRKPIIQRFVRRIKDFFANIDFRSM